MSVRKPKPQARYFDALLASGLLMDVETQLLNQAAMATVGSLSFRPRFKGAAQQKQYKKATAIEALVRGGGGALSILCEARLGLEPRLTGTGTR